jgi:hypothetical protein
MVVIIQTVFADDIEKMMNRYEGMQLEQQVQVIIGGFLT